MSLLTNVPTTQTIYCKACKQLEQTDRKINRFNCSIVKIDGVEYLACYLHAAKTPESWENVPHVQFNNGQRW